MNGYGNLLNAKNMGIVTILCAATATIILLNKQPNVKHKKKIKIKYNNNKYNKNNNNNNNKLTIEYVKQQRDIILHKFEENGHKIIPNEMKNILQKIYECNANEYDNELRLLVSQIIQDYAIMYTNIKQSEPDTRIIKLAKYWLAFNANNNAYIQIEQINHRYALALRSRSIKEFEILLKWLFKLNNNDNNNNKKNEIFENWILRCFQCSCLLGLWENVKKYGRLLEKIDTSSLNNNKSSSISQQSTPLHPLHLFEYIALKLPNQSANFTQVYYNVDKYINRFDRRLTPPLKFTEWKIYNCTTQLKYAFSTDNDKNNELNIQVDKSKKSKPTEVKSSSKYMFIYGCLVQFPCFFVCLPTNNNSKMQPVVLTGPYNDAEMELTASYIRRLPHKNNINKNNDKNNIDVVRSDLRLRLDRSKPNNNDNNNNNNSNNQNGWNWVGDFEHDEGIISCNEKDLNDFEFRRSINWKKKSKKYTCRVWTISLNISGVHYETN